MQSHATANPPQRRFRYLRSLVMLLVIVIGGTAGALWLGVRIHQRNTAIRAIEKLANSIWIDPSMDEGPFFPLRGARSLGQWFGPACFEIEAVNFSGSPVKDVDLKSLEQLDELLIVHLDRTQITDVGLQHLVGLRRLQLLKLDHTQVRNAGMVSIGQLENLEALFLDRTGVGDAGLAELTRLSNLTQLSLAETRITDMGLLHLKELKKLRVLNVAGTEITEAGIADLKRTLPEIEIER